MKWDTIQLGEVMDVKHGYAFKSQSFADSGDLILLTPGNCHDSGGLKLKGDNEKYYIGEFPPEFLLVEGDMLVVMTDLINTAPILGGSFVIPESNRFLHNQRLGLVRVIDESRIDKTFLYYLLNTYDYRAQVRGSASGATVRHTSPGRIKGCKVRLPREVAYQQKIGAILSAYDDLIENNRRRMALLEEAARHLYREWFVRLRFPGHEHTRITNGVPDGWERGRIRDFGDVITGKTPSTRESDNYGGDIPFIKTPDMHGRVFVTETETHLAEKGANTQPGKFIPPHSILVSCIGTVGVVSMTSERSQFNQQINAAVPSDDAYPDYCSITFKDLKENMDVIGGGATIGNVNKTKCERIEVKKPVKPSLRDFHDFTLP